MQTESSRIAEKNRRDWDAYSQKYLAYNHDGRVLKPILEDPAKAFHASTWALIQKYAPDLRGKRVCVPSSGDNHAVFAFALLGARVTSCDISQQQLEGARQTARRIGLDGIDFVWADTMRLDGIDSESYDFVYTSNGVHVWINDLAGMYQNIRRILKPGGIYMMYDIHPFQRPFSDSFKVVKSYGDTGPFEDENSVNFLWRIQDIVNAMLDSGLGLLHIEEMSAEKDYDRPFWLRNEDIINGATTSREEVDRMYDWRQNPAMALPTWLCAVAQRQSSPITTKVNDYPCT